MAKPLLLLPSLSNIQVARLKVKFALQKWASSPGFWFLELRSRDLRLTKLAYILFFFVYTPTLCPKLTIVFKVTTKPNFISMLIYRNGGVKQRLCYGGIKGVCRKVSIRFNQFASETIIMKHAWKKCNKCHGKVMEKVFERS